MKHLLLSMLLILVLLAFGTCFVITSEIIITGFKIKSLQV